MRISDWSSDVCSSDLVLAPVLGAIADQGGGRKPWIGGFTAVAAVCAVLLWWIEPDQSFVLPALLLVAVGNTAFEFGHVFYNAMLPEVAPKSHLGRLSGWAGGLGSDGGLPCPTLSLPVGKASCRARGCA